MGRRPDPETPNRLTDRQRAALQAAADGYSVILAARSLGMATTTYQNLIRRVMVKAGAVNKTNAVAIGFRRGWLK